ncbi:hypothetical protein GCM10009785_31510 [Brooklawnia cerclae]|uniref:ABC transporter permease n=1 Tax=Brooklawnia cerclae TaxID=349934 RepID=A0ABX0SGU2_9ACTN|nr:ABC transporter [Brooklawnia cerclae]NIH56558.1 hypothetical protein [Brooklawnia cerclae]
MTNLLRADWYVLARARGLWLTLLAATAMATGFFVFSHLIAAGTYDLSIAGSVSGLSDVIVVNLLGTLSAGILVADDFSTRSIHDRVLMNSRGTIVAAKTVSFVLLVVVVLTPYIVGSAIAFASQGDFSVFLPITSLELAANPGGIDVNAGSVVKVVLIGVLSGLVYAARIAYCLPLAFVTRKPVVVMAGGFTGAFAIDALASLANRSDLGRDLVNLTPFGEQRALTVTTSGGDIAATLVVCVVFIAAMSVVAWLVFRRADIK